MRMHAVKMAIVGLAFKYWVFKYFLAFVTTCRNPIGVNYQIWEKIGDAFLRSEGTKLGLYSLIG